MMIHFPVIFKLAGQDELLYISDQTSFIRQHQLQQPYLLPEDLLIDSTGQAYQLDAFNPDTASNHAITTFALHELTPLIQAHFFASAQTCVTKIQAADIQTLFSLLQQSA